MHAAMLQAEPSGPCIAYACPFSADVLHLYACRQIAGDGEALAEVAFFTEIVQMESVRSITVAKACSTAHCSAVFMTTRMSSSTYHRRHVT